MNPIHTRACIVIGKTFALLVFTLVLTHCTHHVYVEMPPGQPMRDIEVPSGRTELIPTSASSVGVAYEEDTDHLFLRLVGGTQLWEVERSTGNRIRQFVAMRVTAGCDGGGPGGGEEAEEEPAKECGLAMRYSDRHLFLDHPGGLGLIAEIDDQGTWIQNIQINPHNGQRIGGLAYDQDRNTIYVLYVQAISEVIEIDLSGAVVRRIALNAQTRPFGLSYSSEREELYLELVNETHLGVFDLNGQLIDQHALHGLATVQGIGAGERN